MGGGGEGDDEADEDGAHREEYKGGASDAGRTVAVIGYYYCEDGGCDVDRDCQ